MLRCPEPGYRHCLVSAFAAGVHKEYAAENGFAGLWNMSGFTTMSMLILPTTRILFDITWNEFLLVE